MSEPVYHLTSHVCSQCFGRVLRQTGIGHRQVHRCADCGTEVDGGHQALCCCGIKLRNGKDAGVRCVPNGNKRPDLPSEFVAEQIEFPPK